MTKRYAILLLIILPLALLALRNRFFASEIALIPRNILFGNPVKASPSLSPDGKQIAFLAPLDQNDEKAILNIWIQTLGKNDGRPLTTETERSITTFFWANDGSQILFLKDTKGDENWKLFGISLETKEVTNYTPFEKVQTRIIPHGNRETSKILLGLNKDKPEVHDVYMLDLSTKELTFVCKNPGNIIQWIADRNLTIRAALADLEDGSRVVLLKNGKNWRTIRTYAPEDNNHAVGILAFSTKHNLLYLSECKDYDTAGLVSYNILTDEVSVIAQDPENDLTGVFKHPDSEEIEAVVFEKAKDETRILKPGGVAERIVNALAPYGSDRFIISYDKKLTQCIITITKDISPATYYLYNDKTGTVTELFKARPALKEELLTPMEPISFKSRDGLTIHGYLTCPKNASRSNLPLVLYVHGGPHARDSWGFNSSAQWLANRGYAVLQVNYRGSLGYGKKFVLASQKEWGGKMHDDLIDAVNWAVKLGIADPKKVAIFGGSYGGYAALCGAAFTPDVFCCAIDLVGISNLQTFLKSIPPYWKLYANTLNRMVGNPDTEAEFLKSRSPLFKADAIKCPMLIGQGAHDPRVPQAEAEQIVEALKKHNVEHEYLLFPDEGHGFANAHNRVTFYAATEKFLARHLGGRCEA